MTYRFGRSGLILVTCRLATATDSVLCNFALDTGATRTLLSSEGAATLRLALALGEQVATASGIESSQHATLSRVDALGMTRRDFRILVLPLPRAAGIDGLLGLDFLRDTRLTIDFRRQTIQVADTTGP